MKRLLPASLFVLYSAALIKVMVYKSLPTIHIGHLIFNLGGTDSGQANFIPFTTIVPYLFGNQGFVIAGVNLLGNVALLVPLGVLAPFVSKNLSWKRCLVLAVAAGLSIETLQAVLRIGIFDVDDVILNGFGVMVGFWGYIVVSKWFHARQYKNIIFAAAAIILIAVGALYVLYPKGQPDVRMAQSGNPCGDTQGTGEITHIGSNTITIRRNDGVMQTLNLTSRTVYKTSKGVVSKNSLKDGQRVTLVVNDSTTADDVFVCGA